MSDVADPSAEPTASASQPTSPGAWLKQERERKGLSTQRVAADMHLSTTAIDSIEADRFSTLGAPVFAKGHLRKYAALLGVPPDKIVELYDRLEDAPRQVDPIPLSQRAPEPALRPGIREMLGSGSDNRQRAASINLSTIVVVVVLMGALGGSGWYWLQKARNNESQTDASSVADSKATSDRDSTAKETGVKEPISNEPIAGERIAKTASPAEGAVKRESNPAPPPAASTVVTASTAAAKSKSSGLPPPGKVRVRLSFQRESWVEVYDAGGNRMLYDVGRVDFPRIIDVEPPVLVVLGDVGAVTTEANEKTLTVPAKNISGTVARFTIAADGLIK